MISDGGHGADAFWQFVHMRATRHLTNGVPSKNSTIHPVFE